MPVVTTASDVCVVAKAKSADYTHEWPIVKHFCFGTDYQTSAQLLQMSNV